MKYQYNKKTNIVQLTPLSQDDLWLLSQIIQQDAVVMAKTTRKVSVSETKVEKKTYKMTLKATKAIYDHESLRIAGTVLSEHDDVPKGSAHTFRIDIHNEITIQQPWMHYQLKQLEEASKLQTNIALIVMDREEAYIAQLKQHGYAILAHIQGDVQKKVAGVTGSGTFYKDLIKAITQYNERLKLDAIVLASPSFFKEDVMKLIQEEYKKKIVLATCSDVSERAFPELLKRDEVKQALKQHQAQQELEIIETFLTELSRNGKCTYGIQEIDESASQGAVATLLISTQKLQEMRDENPQKFDTLANKVEQAKGEIRIITSTNDAGKKLDGIGGVAALLRY